MGAFIDMRGRRFGKLVVISRTENFGKDVGWLCRCDCGNEKAVSRGNLMNDSTNSCGCIRNTQGALTRNHPLWKRWSVIIDRCTNPKSKDYSAYGGRGIQVCERWRSFINFLADMESSYRKGLTVERINVNGNYEPTNCKWATTKEQGRNRRYHIMIDTPWGRMSVAEAAERAGIPATALYGRVKRNWPMENIFSKKRFHRFRSGRRVKST